MKSNCTGRSSANILLTYYLLNSLYVIGATLYSGTNPRSTSIERNNFCNKEETYSPINLNFDDSIFDYNLLPAQLKGNWVSDEQVSASLHLTNDSRVVLKFNKNIRMILGGLDFPKRGKREQFIMNQCYIHWGPSPYEHGAEHSIDFREAHMELQCEFLKHWTSSTGRKRTKSTKTKPRIVVSTLAVFVNNPEDAGVNKLNMGWKQTINRIVDLFNRVTTKVYLKLTFQDFLQMWSPNWESYYTYNGTLTFPPCDPNVRWFVFTEPVILALNISRNLFRSTSTDHFNKNNQNFVRKGSNSRPALKKTLIGRKVLRSFSTNLFALQRSENKETFERLTKSLIENKEARNTRMNKVLGGRKKPMIKSSLKAKVPEAVKQNMRIESKLNEIGKRPLI